MIYINPTEIESHHFNKHPDYEYSRKNLVPRNNDYRSQISIYEILPGKSSYPLHYHSQQEESFYILSGTGTLQHSGGVCDVKEGDFFFFPSGEEGAHKLTNTGSEPLRYIDFDVRAPLDTCFYPDSGKIGVYTADSAFIFRLDDAVDYYDGE